MADVERMWRLLTSEEETACLTCPVRPVNPLESFLAASQSLECKPHHRHDAVRSWASAGCTTVVMCVSSFVHRDVSGTE